MEYTVQKLAKMAGISTRTLRYYDEIGILKPARINSSGYRIYGSEQVDMLQQILFYKELGVELENVKKIMALPSFNKVDALKEHREKLLERKNRIELLISSIDKTIEQSEGRIVMSDKEKFEGFKKKMIEENEEKYGEEIRSKYGNETIDKSNQKLKNMSRDEYDKLETLTKQLEETLEKAFAQKDPSSELAQRAADLHRQWLCYYWESYSKEAHAQIVNMYVEDERFKAYYDKKNPGTAEFLRDAVLIYTGMKK